jgi:hypothetical protein
MYIFDPLIGRRRRALARDKMTRFFHKTVDACDVTSRDLKNRVLGVGSRDEKFNFQRKRRGERRGVGTAGSLKPRSHGKPSKLD